jgi:hypothetical protein
MGQEIIPFFPDSSKLAVEYLGLLPVNSVGIISVSVFKADLIESEP